MEALRGLALRWRTRGYTPLGSGTLSPESDKSERRLGLSRFPRLSTRRLMLLVLATLAVPLIFNLGSLRDTTKQYLPAVPGHSHFGDDDDDGAHGLPDIYNATDTAEIRPNEEEFRVPAWWDEDSEPSKNPKSFETPPNKHWNDPFFAGGQDESPEPKAQQKNPKDDEVNDWEFTKAYQAKMKGGKPYTGRKKKADKEKEAKQKAEKEKQEAADLAAQEPVDRRFVVVLPANFGNADLCKIISSGFALGYPSPIIVNWGRKFDDSEGWTLGHHIGKIEGVLTYLDRMSQAETFEDERLSDDDIVAVLDAYDIWFQLPPDVLLHRYHAAIKAANEGLKEAWGSSEYLLAMENSILVSAQKKCYPPPESGSDLHCSALPNSTLPDDVYGKNTDMDPEENPNGYHDVRPKFLNSGSMMGPVGDMKRYFRRVKERLDKNVSEGKKMYSDQGIFGEVFGEQEMWRSRLREKRKANELDLKDEETKMILDNFEYHVGLDYTQELFLPTFAEEQDGEIIALDNVTGIADESKLLDIDPVRLEGVPKDIKDAHNPLLDINMDTARPDWGDMPLYADFYTTAVPVALHHNAHKDGLKQRREWWWDRTWYFPYLRRLIKAHMAAKPLKALGVVGKTTYYALPSDAERRGPRLFSVDEGVKVSDFDTVCQATNEKLGEERDWWDEVFRDEQGPLAL